MTDISRTDILFHAHRLYIEGVQVPFEQIIIQQGEGTLPTAEVSIPAMAGLMDIARFYRPKVHIFFTDNISTHPNTTAKDKSRDKLIFSGYISQVSYAKSKSGNGNAAISFHCKHKNTLLTRTLVDYSGWLNDTTDQQNSSAAVKGDHANSGSAILEAMNGIGGGVNASKEITQSNPNGDTNVLPSKLAPLINRYVGIPGIAINYWNQLKRSAFNQGANEVSDGWLKLYQPLVEDGLLFFDRLGGHYSIEKDIEASRMVPCDSAQEVLVPPAHRLFLTSAVQAQMAPDMLRSYLQTSGELTDFYSVLQTIFERMEYDMLTLSAPAEAPVVPPGVDQKDASVSAAVAVQQLEASKSTTTSAIETIIKPKTPFYYSPSCNVLTPGMYYQISVGYDEENVPTRIDIKNTEYPGLGRGTHFRAPASIRQAISKKTKSNTGTLLGSEGPSYGAVGRYEQGRGVEVEYLLMPPWLALLSNAQFSSGLNSEIYPDATKDPENYAALQQLAEGWKARYPSDFDKSMNPWSPDAGIPPHHRLLFAAADYYYTKLVARSKIGSVECPYNPYMVPGYPMDILESNPTLPSYHALCSSVTHVISSSGVSTSVNFVAAMTYSELANYYVPFIFPYLQIALGLATSPTLVNNTEEAKAAADAYYYTTLGVKSVAPEDIYDFEKYGLPKPVKKDASGKIVAGTNNSVKGSNGGEINPYLSYEGNLWLFSRPIEDRKLVEERFKIKFVDLDVNTYSGTGVTFVPGVLSDSSKLELGQSQFLDYSTYFGEQIK